MANAIVFWAKQHKRLVVRIGTVGALLCILVALGIVGTRIEPLFVLAALLVPVGVLVVAKRIELGMVATLLAGVFVRFRIPTGTESEIVISLVIGVGCIALWILHMLIEDRRLFLRPTPINTPLLGFMATVVFSLLWGRAFRDPLVHELGHPLVSVAAAAVMVLLPACALLAANSIRNVDWLKALVWVLLAAGLVVLSLDLLSQLNLAPLQAISTFLSTNGVVHINTQGLLSMWCLALSLSMALFHRRLRWPLRALLLVYAGVWVYWGFVTRLTWLAGWVPAFAAALTIAFLRSKWFFVILALVLVIGAGGYYWETRFQEESQISGLTRLAAYEVNWRITSRHLLFGTGPANYASYYMSYFPTEAMASHSNYIDLVAQTGIIGSFFFLWFFGAQGWSNYRMSLGLHGRGDFAEGLSAALLGGTAGCVIAMALGDWLLPFAYTNGIVGFDLAVLNWLFMGSAWALRRHLERVPARGRQV